MANTQRFDLLPVGLDHEWCSILAGNELKLENFVNKELELAGELTAGLTNAELSNWKMR